MGRRFTGLQINFYVSDVERAVAFYTAIGAVESFRTPREGRPLHVEVTLAGVTVGLASVDAARDLHRLDVLGHGKRGRAGALDGRRGRRSASMPRCAGAPPR